MKNHDYVISLDKRIFFMKVLIFLMIICLLKILIIK